MVLSELSPLESISTVERLRVCTYPLRLVADKSGCGADLCFETGFEIRAKNVARLNITQFLQCVLLVNCGESGHQELETLI